MAVDEMLRKFDTFSMNHVGIKEQTVGFLVTRDKTDPIKNIKQNVCMIPLSSWVLQSNTEI